MTRRPGSRSVTVERPRRKGWWGEPEAHQLEDEDSGLPPVPREQASRTPSRNAHNVVQVGRALTPGQIEAIRTVMRLFVEEDASRGIDPRCTLFCHRCSAARCALGSVRYDRFTLCNDCSADYEIAHARGQADGVTEFLDRYAARAASA